MDFSHVAMKSVPFKTCSLSDANCKVVEPVFSATVSLGASSNGTSACVPPRTDHPTALETSTAYCVFKHLPREAFWVNLNPNEPDRVMDARMARTESGRLLLESDLWLKKTAAIYLHPDHALGSAFWKRVYGQVGRGRDGRLCYSLRQWIVPGAIQIAHVVGRGKGGEAGRGAEVTVHLIQARMAVRHESAFEEVRPPRHGVSSDRSRSADDPKLVALPSSLPLRYRFHRFSLSLSLSLWTQVLRAEESRVSARRVEQMMDRMCRGANKTLKRFAEETYEAMVLPSVENHVNAAAEYERLRYLFYWRIVSEYVRNLLEGGGGHGDDGDDGDEGAHPTAAGQPAPSALASMSAVDPVKDPSWRKEDLFASYLRSVSKGEFKIKREVEEDDIRE